MDKISLHGVWRTGLHALVAAVLGLGLSAPAAADADAAAQELAVRSRALARAHAAVVGIRVEAVEDAASIATLGRARQGSGVVIGADGLVLTIGYLILEAEQVNLLVQGERAIPARVVAYDPASGFGLLQALAPLRVAPVRLGTAAAAPSDELLLIASGGAQGGVSLAQLVSRRAFTGYWEYHIEGALFTAPPRPDHSGAALFNVEGELLGIGSLIVADALGPGSPSLPGNMFVPVDLLKPILGELRASGSSRDSHRAWIGANCVERDGVVVVVRIAAESPADAAGLRPGDQIVRIDSTDVNGLAGFYKSLWMGDSPEREIRLDVRRRGVVQTISVQTTDRLRTLRHAVGV